MQLAIGELEACSSHRDSLVDGAESETKPEVKHSGEANAERAGDISGKVLLLFQELSLTVY